MPLLETTVAAAGRLALAAAYDNRIVALESRAADRRAGKQSREALRPKYGSNLPKAAIYTVAALAWLSERKTLTRHKLDHDAKAAVRFKDLLVAGAVITGFADIAVEELMRHRASRKKLSSTADDLEMYRRYRKVMRPVNRAFVAGAVAATPFINFGLFNAYKPHPFRSFFKL